MTPDDPVLLKVLSDEARSISYIALCDGCMHVVFVFNGKYMVVAKLFFTKYPYYRTIQHT